MTFRIRYHDWRTTQTVPSYMRFTCKLTSRKMTSNKRICEVVVLEGNLNLLKSFIEEQHYDPKQKGTGGSTLLHYMRVLVVTLTW